MFSKDLSKKVKTAKRQRAYSGFFISSQTPFGYIQDPNNKNKLIIDKEAADIVKYLFELALKGLGSVAIAKRLTAERVITPSYYKYINGDTRFERFNKRGDGWEYKWCYTTIRTILKDMVYVGDMENRKYEVQNYKTKKRVRVPQDKHIIVPNTHEGIISRADYEKVQQLISARNTPA